MYISWFWSQNKCSIGTKRKSVLSYLIHIFEISKRVLHKTIIDQAHESDKILTILHSCTQSLSRIITHVFSRGLKLIKNVTSSSMYEAVKASSIIAMTNGWSKLELPVLF